MYKITPTQYCQKMMEQNTNSPQTEGFLTSMIKNKTPQAQMGLKTPLTDTPQNLNNSDRNELLIKWPEQADGMPIEEKLHREKLWRLMTQKENEEFGKEKLLSNPVEGHCFDFKARQRMISQIIEHMVWMQCEDNQIFLTILQCDAYCRELQRRGMRLSHINQYKIIASICVWLSTNFYAEEKMKIADLFDIEKVLNQDQYEEFKKFTLDIQNFFQNDCNLTDPFYWVLAYLNIIGEWFTELEVDMIKAVLLTAQFDDKFITFKPSLQAQAAIVVVLTASQKSHLIQTFFTMLRLKANKKLKICETLYKYCGKFKYQKVGAFIKYYYGLEPTGNKKLFQQNQYIKRKPNVPKNVMLKLMFGYQSISDQQEGKLYEKAQEIEQEACQAQGKGDINTYVKKFQEKEQKIQDFKTTKQKEVFSYKSIYQAQISFQKYSQPEVMYIHNHGYEAYSQQLESFEQFYVSELPNGNLRPFQDLVQDYFVQVNNTQELHQLENQQPAQKRSHKSRQQNQEKRQKSPPGAQMKGLNSQILKEKPKAVYNQFC